MDKAIEVRPNVDTATGDPLVELELDAVVGYKLSDAIRDGAQEVPQAVGSWGDGVTNACALATAQKAIDRRGYGVK